LNPEVFLGLKSEDVGFGGIMIIDRNLVLVEIRDSKVV
jgi:hypothetical protein